MPHTVIEMEHIPLDREQKAPPGLNEVESPLILLKRIVRGHDLLTDRPTIDSSIKVATEPIVLQPLQGDLPGNLKQIDPEVHLLPPDHGIAPQVVDPEVATSLVHPADLAVPVVLQPEGLQGEVE